MANDSIMSLLFGKKKARKRTSTKKTASGKIVRPKALTAALRKQAKKYKVKTRTMRGSKHTGYRKVSLIKKDIRRKKKKADAKKKLAKTTPKRRRRAKKSAFGSGVGGSYMPLSSFMSPSPFATSSTAPWI